MGSALPCLAYASDIDFLDTFDAFQESVSDGSQDVQNDAEAIELPNFSDSANEGAYVLVDAIQRFLDFFKLIVTPIAVLMTIFVGVKMVTAGKESEEVSRKSKTYIRYFVEGLIVIFMADAIVSVIFGAEGGIFRGGAAGAEEYAAKTASLMEGIMSLIETLVGSLAVFSLVTAGMRYVGGSYDDDQIGKAKKQITWSLVGLFVVGISEFVVKKILFPDQGAKLGVESAKQLFAQVTNFIAGTMGTLAFVFLIYAGFLYLMGAQSEDNVSKAKKIIFTALIGIVIAISAFAFSNTFITLDASR